MKPFADAEPASSGESQAGQVLDARYRLVAELARGGMGRVFVAVDTELRRRVAIKLIAAPAPSATARARFWQEAVALASVSHPNVLTIYDATPKEHQGEPYLVCELLEGATLREAAASPLPLAQVLDFAVQIASGLAAAHDQEIVHRDLKPENIFVTREGRVKLIDFGIAKLLAPAETLSGEAPAEATPVAATAEGSVIGSAGYMAPEQVRGGPIDRRADLFSFGSVLFELVTSRRAFDGPTAHARGQAILNDPPPPLGAEVPDGVRRLIGRCLEKSPERRFQTARELLGELEAARAAVARGPRRPWLIPLGVAIALAICLAAWVLRHRRPSRAGELTVALARVRADAAEAEVAAALDLAFERALGTLQGVFRATQLPPGAETDGSSDWVLRSHLSGAGGKLRLDAQFETSAGQKVGEPLEAIGTRDELLKDADELGARVRDLLLPLWRDRARRVRAESFAHASAAEEKLLAYYDLMGPAPRMEFLDRGRALLDDAIAADPRYVPALAERAALLRLASSRNGDDPAEDLRRSRADAEEALRLAPGDPQALQEKCLTTRVQMRDRPSDDELAAATAACSDAAQANARSVDALYSLAALYDQACDDRPLLDALKLAYDRAQRFDRSWLGDVTFYLSSFALQRKHLQEAERFSSLLLAEQAREDLGAPATAPPLQGAHLLRAAVLLRLGRIDEAEREVEAELSRGAGTIGGLDDKREAAGLRALQRIARLRNGALEQGRAARLAALERRFALEDESSDLPSAVVGWFGFVDPEGAVQWMEQHKTQPGCALAFQRAVIYRDAGLGDRAAQALAGCEVTGPWARRCFQDISSALPKPASPPGATEERSGRPSGVH